MIAPADPGAVAVSVKTAAPLAVDAGIALVSVTAHDSNAPAAEGSAPQLTDETLVPAVTAVAITPAGS